MSEDLTIKILQQIREHVAQISLRLDQFEANTNARFDRLEAHFEKRIDTLSARVADIAGAIVTILSMIGRMNDDIAMLKARPS